MKKNAAFFALVAGIVAAFAGYAYYTGADLSDLWQTFLSYARKAKSKVTTTAEDVAGASDPFEKALDLISDFEGFSAKAYPDADGYSIGYGHFIQASDPYNSSSVITESEAWDLLSQDASAAQACVTNSVKVPISTNQAAALISLCYNIGCGNFQASSLLRKLNAGDYAGAAAEFGRWNQSRGQVLQALVNRRAKEQNVFVS